MNDENAAYLHSLQHVSHKLIWKGSKDLIIHFKNQFTEIPPMLNDPDKINYVSSSS